MERKIVYNIMFVFETKDEVTKKVGRLYQILDEEDIEIDYSGKFTSASVRCTYEQMKDVAFHLGLDEYYI